MTGDHLIPRFRTNPATIRLVLAYGEHRSVNAAASRFGISHRSVTAWRAARAVMGPDWPTLEVDRAWLATRESRAAKASRLASYRARRYLNSGACLQVDATGTRRRLQALMAIGWPAWAIVLHGPWSHPESVYQLRHRTRVTAANAAAVTGIYDLLSMTPGPSAQTRRRATAAGWPPPLAWDEDGIDNPKVLPSTYLLDDTGGDGLDEAVVLRILAGDLKGSPNPTERLEVIRRWDRSGRLRADLVRLTGWKLERYLLLEVS